HFGLWNLLCHWAWLLTCALFIATTASGFTQKGLRQMLLEKLGLPDVPVFQRTDLENLVIPQNIRNKYISILKHRSALNRSPGLLLDLIAFSDTTRQNLIFDMEGRIPENSEVTMAELKLFKKPLERKHLPSRPSQRPVLNARVSVYLVQHQENGTNRTSLIDSRLVPIMESGWKNFDVTQAVHFWLKAKKPGPILLEIWIEGERLGNYPAGYQAYRCVGGCRQPKNLPHHFGYGERTCAVVESSPLPMMYLVKKGNYTEIEVAEFPNMIVEKCGCVMDNIAVV
uniref:TGF-beta family profile domain-containing protein n=1 Tax=Varanus komodoensis TaxID=61221 RepID=A0A8D2LK47_VARKO